jgi:hypothetical protein
MLRKLSVAATVALIATLVHPAAISAQPETSMMQAIKGANGAGAAQTVLDHIAQETTAIYAELSLALSFMERGEQHFQEQLGDDYLPCKQRAMDVLRTILESPEFASTVQQVTDEQVELIADQLINFNDIIIDPSVFPLEQKIENELKAAAFDEQMQQIFNIFYVAFVTKRGVEMLLEKLAVRSDALAIELETL